jgi:SAM-dependent methyltransferase
MASGGVDMVHNNEEILAHWNRENVESMYDKYLLNAEIELISKRIQEYSRILDAGCGEGEGTLAYSSIPGVRVHGVDFSEMRLRKAAERLSERPNVTLQQVDLLGEYPLDTDYDIVVTQRCLINLTEWQLQSRALLYLMSRLGPTGKLLMLEGSRQGVDSLNQFRALWGLEPLPVQWHNLFFDDEVLVTFMEDHGFRLLEEDGLGAYFLLTRGVRPNLDEELNWDCNFNMVASRQEMADMLGFGSRFSRLKLWVFGK